MTKKSIIVKKVNLNEYLELKQSNLLPFVVEVYEGQNFDNVLYTEDETYSTEDVKAYVLDFNKAQNEEFSMLYYGDPKKINCNDFAMYAYIESIVGGEEGYINICKLEDGTKVISVPRPVLLQKVFKNNRKTNDKASNRLSITLKVSTFNEYENLRKENQLPLAIEMTDYEARVIAKPFDGLYANMYALDSKDKNILVIDAFHLIQAINNGSIELAGISLPNNDVFPIQEIYGGSIGNDFGGFYTNDDEFISIEEIAFKIINNRQKELSALLRNKGKEDTIKRVYTFEDGM